MQHQLFTMVTSMPIDIYAQSGAGCVTFTERRELQNFLLKVQLRNVCNRVLLRGYAMPHLGPITCIAVP